MRQFTILAHDTRRILSLVILLASTTLGVVAQPRFVPDTDIKKVGEVAFQMPRKFSIGFTNKGDKPLLIQEVKASCGCLDVLYPQAPIAAGARGEITLTFDAKLLGTFYKELEVRTNASDEPKYIGIQGSVVTEIQDFSDEFPFDLGGVRLETNTIEFEDVSLGDKPTAELRVLNTDRTAYRPELMHLPPYLTAECEPKDIPAGKIGTIRLTLDSEKLSQLGLSQTSIYLSRYLGDKIGDENEISHQPHRHAHQHRTARPPHPTGAGLQQSPQRQHPRPHHTSRQKHTPEGKRHCKLPQQEQGAHARPPRHRRSQASKAIYQCRGE